MRPERMMEQFYVVPFGYANFIYMFTDDSWVEATLVKVIEND